LAFKVPGFQPYYPSMYTMYTILSIYQIKKNSFCHE